jgi:hypothetical protein
LIEQMLSNISELEATGENSAEVDLLRNLIANLQQGREKEDKTPVAVCEEPTLQPSPIKSVRRPKDKAD